MTTTPTRADYPLTVLAAITELNTGGSVILHDAERAVLVSPAALVDVARVRLHELTCGMPVSVVLDSALFDEMGLGIDDSGGAPIGRPVDVDPVPFTAMSRAGRARTVRALARSTPASELVSPGHVAPVRSSPGNLLTRVGLVEGAIDLMLLAGQEPAAMTSFLMDEEANPILPGSAQLPEGLRGLPVVAVRDVRSARLVESSGDPETAVEALFFDAMVRVPSGISVISARDASGAPTGLVVSSMTSYSSNPPSIIVSIATTTRSHPTLMSTEYFGVNILASDQADHARVFSARDVDRFAAVPWQWDGEVPRLDGVQTFFRCRRTAQFSFGDHSLLIGSIVSGESRAVPPLVYVNRGFDWKLT